MADVPSDQVEKLAEKGSGNSTKEHTYAPIQVLVLKRVHGISCKEYNVAKTYLEMAAGGTSCWRGQPEAGGGSSGEGETAITVSVSLEGIACKVGS